MQLKVGRVASIAAAVVIAAAGLAATTGTSSASAHAATRAAGHHAEHWVASWTASPTDSLMPIDAAGVPVPLLIDNQSLRMIVTPHLGGTTLRVHLSNRFGHAPLKLGHVTVGVVRRDGVAHLETVTFGGHRSATVPVGHDVISDPAHVRFTAFERLAISMYLPGTQSFPTKHWNANATSYYTPAGAGDQSASTSDKSFTQRTQAWLYVDGVDVRAPRRTASIVAFGDSITDGFVAATPLSEPVNAAIANKNGRYPDDLQRRLDTAHVPLSVVNAGIGSNRLVTDGEPLMMGLSGVQRFRRDALDVAGVKGVILQEGINDFGLPPATTTPAELIAGYKKVIRMAHAAGLKIWLGTLLPASDAFFDGTITAPNSERYREQANAWIRRQHLADGVIDFDKALRDPAHPDQLIPADSGPDHLHPNLRGYRLMAKAVHLSMLRTALRVHGTTSRARKAVRRHTYGHGETAHRYIVYTPPSWRPRDHWPLLVMLHGCETTAYEQMKANLYNPLAARKHFIVVYPDTDELEDSQPGPTTHCWQFPLPTDWQRGQGDGAAVAAITRAVIRGRHIDRQRVYVMGMSAGSFLSADVAAEYPDLFTASGENAGGAYADGTCVIQSVASLPVGTSATLAYQQMGKRARVVPRIVIGGDHDQGVPPACANKALMQGLRTDNLVIDRKQTAPISLTATSTRRAKVPQGYSYTVSDYRDGRCLVGQRYLVHGMNHFWSGGSANPKWKSFTDPRGPSAAKASWKFFSRFTRRNTALLRHSC